MSRKSSEEKPGVGATDATADGTANGPADAAADSPADITADGPADVTADATAAGAVARPVGRRRLVVGALLAGSGVLVLAHRAYETAEIALSGVVLSLFGPGDATVSIAHQTVYFGLCTPTPLGLRMTAECTSAFLLVPLACVSALLIALRPRITGRILFSLAMAGIALVIVNQLRLLTVANLVGWLGTDRGYYWGHTLIGSLVSVLGGAVALALFVWLATRPGRAEFADPPPPTAGPT